MPVHLPKLERTDLVYPELCYQVMGILFDVWKEVGYGHKERMYQQAVANGLREAKLVIQEQLPTKVLYKDKPVGLYYFDFLIEGKIILELKTRNYFSKQDLDQIYAYLKASDLKLGVLALFTRSGVKYKRIVNVE